MAGNAGDGGRRWRHLQNIRDIPAYQPPGLRRLKIGLEARKPNFSGEYLGISNFKSNFAVK